MPILQGLDITVSIYRRVQLDDDDVGGSVFTRELKYSRTPAKITQMPTPMILRTQGIEATDNFDCVVQPYDYNSLYIQMDDILVPESGQYLGLDFVVTNVYDNPLANAPVDYRFIHHRLSLKRITMARREQ